VKQGQEFMLHLKSKAETAWSECKAKGTLIKVSSCPVCDGTELELAFEFLNFPYSLCKNNSCAHVFISERADDATTAAFFAHDPLYSNKNYCDPALVALRKEQIAVPKVEFVLEQLSRKPGRWLDVGCGNGEIISAAKDRGWSVTGLELSTRDAELARSHYKLDVHECTLEAFCQNHPAERFDIISFFGVLHCIPNPVSLVQQTKQLLNPDGAVVMQVTNANSVSTRAIKTFPHNPSRSPHNGLTTLHQFTESSVNTMLSRAELSAQAVWFFGADIFELLNQWSLAAPELIDSALYESLLEKTNDFQLVFDKNEQSESMLWIARPS